jgi:lipopolysaccharide export LptBFGC system permease protein LptF
MKTTEIIGLIVAAILLGVLLPIALNDILGFTSDNSTIQTLVATILPVIAVIAIILMFVPRDR